MPLTDSAVSRGRIYLIDDNSDVLLHLGDLLRLEGFETDCFDSAPAFLGTDRPRSGAVIVMDMRMRGMSGLEAFRLMRARGIDTPVIFLSGASHPQEIIDALRGGADNFLLKPVRATDLVLAIQSAIAADRTRALKRRRSEVTQGLLVGLSSRECEIFIAVVSGHPNRVIAEMTGLQAGTIKKYRASILAKLGLSETSELIELMRGLSQAELSAALKNAKNNNP